MRGTRAVRVVQGRRDTNFTMTFAISNFSGLVHHELSEGGMTGERFVHFLQTVYTNHRANAAVFIVDNAASRRLWSLFSASIFSISEYLRECICYMEG